MKQITESVPEDDEASIQAEIDNQSDTGMILGGFLNIVFEKRINQGEWETVTDLSDIIQITIDVPEEFKVARATYYVIRCHKGVTTVLPDLDEETDTVTIETDGFSTYAIAYTLDETKDAVTNSWAQYMWWILIAGVVTAIFFIIVLLKRRKEEEDEKLGNIE